MNDTFLEFAIHPDDASSQTQNPSLSEPNDKFPGSFFRIPGIPVPGHTTWSIAP